MTYFSVDVETSGLVPGRHTLLSIGVVELASGAEFYAVIDTRETSPDNFDLPPVKWDAATREWFKTQKAAYAHLFDPATERHSPKDVAESLAQWVGSFPEPRTFVAWPVSFDKPWLDILFHDTGVTNPFDYRSVDIKSWICGRFGGGPEVERDELPPAAQALYIEPDFPHHALNDARAQADTMRMLLEFGPNPD